MGLFDELWNWTFSQDSLWYSANKTRCKTHLILGRYGIYLIQFTLLKDMVCSGICKKVSQSAVNNFCIKENKLWGGIHKPNWPILIFFILSSFWTILNYDSNVDFCKSPFPHRCSVFVHTSHGLWMYPVPNAGIK